MNIKQAMQEVNQDLVTVIKGVFSSAFLKGLGQLTLYLLLILSGIASFGWSIAFYISDPENLVENSNVLLILAWITFIVSGYANLVMRKLDL